MKRVLFFAFLVIFMLADTTVFAVDAEDIFKNFSTGDETFIDVDSSHWAYEAISYLTKSGVLSGVGENMFMPSNNIKRAEYVKLVTVCTAILDKSATSDYTDISKDDWSYTYVSSAKKAGLLDIYNDSEFGKDVIITREDMAYIAAKALLYIGIYESYDLNAPKFDDDLEISDYAKESVYFLREKGIINGINNSNFAPTDNATRAEAAKIMYSLVKLTEREYLEN